MFDASNIHIDNEFIAIRKYPAPRASTAVIMVHGAGQSSQQGMQPICEFLQHKGLYCISFDFSGQGESSSNSISSLRKKSRQLQVILDRLTAQFDALVLVASSMGGQITLNALAGRTKIIMIVLMNPGLYGRHCVNTPFNQQFTLQLRRPRSFEFNNAAEILGNFEGRVVLLRSECDEVIPNRVFEIYEQAARPENFMRIDVAGAPHSLPGWLAEDAGRLQRLYKDITSPPQSPSSAGRRRASQNRFRKR